MFSKRVILDAGHGGADPGAVYQERMEKDDNLKLALAVGKILQSKGVDVVYTRVNDIYQTPYEKAVIANMSGADYFISFHRNAVDGDKKASGAITLVYKDQGVPALLAENINEGLSKAGYKNLGIDERPAIIVLKRTAMPAVLIETGFLDNPMDNKIFDENFDKIAEGIADGILNTISEEEMAKPEYYQVQVGAYTDRNLAVQLLNKLLSEGYPAFMIYKDGYYKVRSGAFLEVDNAAAMERRLRKAGYSTWIVKEPEA